MKPFEPQSRWADRLDRVRAAIADVTPRFLDLLRGVRNPDALAVGEWRTSDVAAHLSHAAAGELLLAKSIGVPYENDVLQTENIIEAAADFNANFLEADPERDVLELANRIEKSVVEFMEIMGQATGNEPVSWLGGTTLPAALLPCHLLEELLVHGFDIARVEDVTWDIEPEQAALGFGFLLDLIRLAAPEARKTFVDQEAAGGRTVAYDFRMRGQRRDYLIIEDGLVTVEEPSARRIDCHISAEPVAAMLLGWGRIGHAKPALTGKTVAWGRKPWLAFKLNSFLKNP